MYEKYAELRDAKGLTDYRVSKDTGITKSTFSDWKNGRSEPKMEKLKILSNYFNVSIEYFVGDGEGWNGMNIKEYKQIRDEAEEFSREILNKIPENFTLLHLECLGKIFPQVIENELIIQKSKAKPIINQSSLQK